MNKTDLIYTDFINKPFSKNYENKLDEIIAFEKECKKIFSDKEFELLLKYGDLQSELCAIQIKDAMSYSVKVLDKKLN